MPFGLPDSLSKELLFIYKCLSSHELSAVYHFYCQADNAIMAADIIIQLLSIFPFDQIFQSKILGTNWKMIKNYIEIFISGSRNIELLILTMKTKYFCSAVVLGGFEI